MRVAVVEVWWCVPGGAAGGQGHTSKQQSGEKKPAVCSRKMSTVTTWSTPTSSKRALTSAQEIGSRPRSFWVWRQ